jgi:DNA (cytosine-5)-methyltransferase 1
MTVGSLFAGIGGFDLGFQRAGYEIVWQVEIDDYCRRVLAKHFPNAERFGDIRECGKHNLRPVDVIVGGFPCQDISSANPAGGGIDGDRSGLWKEYQRVICELRPKFIVVENVSNLLKRGIGRVLSGLAAIGYDAEWQCLPASSFGAPHSRDRIWIVAYPQQAGFSANLLAAGRAFSEGTERAREFWKCGWMYESPGQYGRWMDAAPEARVAAKAWEYAPCEPLLLGVPDGISKRLERIGGLGNAVVPQIAQWIAEIIRERAGRA